MRIRMFAAVSILAVLMAAAAMAADSATSTQQVKIPDSKKKVLLELFEIMDYRGQMLEISKTMTGQIKEQSREMMSRMMDSEKLTDEEKSYIENEFMPEYVQKMTDSLTDIFKDDSIIIDILMPVYSKQFSENELIKLIEFYRTPVGEKVVRTMPEITQEVMQALMTEYSPKMQQTVKDVTLEMIQKYQDKFGK